MQKSSKLIVILGPTASGKTEITIQLAKKFNGEIVSADSRTIYKWMDIGTAKSLRDLKIKKYKNIKIIKQSGYYSGGVRHHLIDIVRPYEEFTLADFKKRALQAIKSIIRRGKTPFLVGGTGLYIQSIVDNLEIPEIPPDKKLRNRLEKKTEKQLFTELKKLDSESAEQIGENKRKLIRALEVCLKTGKKFSELTKKGELLFSAKGGSASGEDILQILQIGISHPREELYRRINLRAQKMIDAGLIEEVKSIVNKLRKKMSVRKIWQLSSMSGIGYKQIGMYLRKEVNLDEAIRILQRDTRHYAKRQISWFKRDKRIKWIKDIKKIESVIKKFLD